MTVVVPTVEVFFDLSETGGAFFTLDDPVRGVLDNVDYPLGGDVATDITPFVYDIAVNRGRSRELDEIQAGTCAIKLRNYDGRFLPDDLAGSASGTYVQTGATVTTDGDDTILTWTSGGTFEITSGAYSAHVLLVGGGGGGGSVALSSGNGAGGGGAGEVFTSYGGSAYLLDSSQSTIAVSVGAGGAGGAHNTSSVGGSGGDSTIGGTGLSLAVVGGGGGGGGGSNMFGAAGGSGGGGPGTRSTGVGYPGGSATAALGSGNGGGSGYSSSQAFRAGGGGGGAAAVGQSAYLSGSTPNGGNGGDGITTSITGTAVTYGGGGGGGARQTLPGAGGAGGGGNGARGNAAPLAGDGVDGLGGGGGGAGVNNSSSPASAGGDGGSGIVVLRITPADSKPYGVDNIRPGKRVRVSVGGSAIFDGVIDAWDYSFSADKRVDASFTATDALSSLARKSLDEWTTTAGQTAGERLVDLLNRPEVQYPANRDIDAGISTLTDDTVAWNTNALQYAQLVAKSELGRLFAAANGVLTFRDRHSLVNASASVAFADDGSGISFNGVDVDTSSVLLANRVSVEPVGGTIQTAQNSSSIGRFGVRQLSLSGILLDSDAQAADMAGFLSNIYGEPQTRIASLDIYLDGLSAVERAQVLALDLASVVSVAWTPTGASSQTVQLSVVEGVRHQTGVASLHVVSLSLSPIAQSEVFVLDSDVLGVLDSGVLAY